MTIVDAGNIVIVGGDGEFGSFLRRDVLPSLKVSSVSIIERETPAVDQLTILGSARHIVLATPLAGYAELACQLIYRCRELSGPVTLWFIPSVQSGVWRAVTATLEIVANPRLSAIFVHPMYGPNGFRETEPEARTFQNVLTASHAGLNHSLDAEIVALADAFTAAFNITTTSAFDPDQHDRITAYSQGLSYCVGKLMFDDSRLAEKLRERMPDLHHSFSANHDLILDFIRINSYMPQVLAAFADSWQRTNQRTFTDILSAFANADSALNPNGKPPISTKWYERLRSTANSLVHDRKA